MSKGVAMSKVEAKYIGCFPATFLTEYVNKA